MAAQSGLAAALGRVDAVVRCEDFQRRSKAFAEEHCGAFDYADENKLDYTTIHQKYQEEVEAYLLEKIDSADVEMLLEGLPKALTQGKLNSVDSEAAETLDLLVSLGDFQAFKDFMLMAKYDLEEAGAPVTATLKGHDLMNVPGYEAQLEGLAAAMQEKAGWSSVADKGWYKIDMREDGEGGGAILRSASVLGLSPSDAKRMVLSYGKPEMTRWMDMLEKTEILKENSANDYVVRMTTSLTGILGLLAAGAPKTMDLRLFTAADFPEKGDFSIVSIPWDAETDAMPTSSLFKMKASCIRPVAGEPNKTLITTVSPKAASWVPKWAMNAMYSHWGPKHVAGMVSKFKSYKASSQTVTAEE